VAVRAKPTSWLSPCTASSAPLAVLAVVSRRAGDRPYVNVPLKSLRLGVGGLLPEVFGAAMAEPSDLERRLKAWP